VTDGNVSEELLFKDKHPVRTVIADGALWFDVRDLAQAMGFTWTTVDLAASSRSIPDCCRTIGTEMPDEGEAPGDASGQDVLLSSLGVFYWTHVTDPARGQALAAWAKKEAERLVPEASKDDPRAYLQLEPDGTMPAFCPYKFSGRKSEWYALNDKMWDLRLEATGGREAASAPSEPPSEAVEAKLLAEAQAAVDRARAIAAARDAQAA
jgi:hypothetical protein